MNVRSERVPEANYRKKSPNIPDEFTLVVLKSTQFEPMEKSVICLSNPVKCHFDTRMRRLGLLAADSIWRLQAAFHCYFGYTMLPPDLRNNIVGPCQWLNASAPTAQNLSVRTILLVASSLQVSSGPKSDSDPSLITAPTEQTGTTSGVTRNAEDAESVHTGSEHNPVDTDQRKLEESRVNIKRHESKLESREEEVELVDEISRAISDSEGTSPPPAKRQKTKHASSEV